LKYLLDTNILSEPLKPLPSKKALTKLKQHQNEISTCTVVLHEMWFGCLRLDSAVKRKLIEEYIQAVIWPTVPILPYDYASAVWHAGERARLTSIGKIPGFVDSQIAAIARTNKLILVTANTKDFAAFHDLQVENWL